MICRPIEAKHQDVGLELTDKLEHGAQKWSNKPQKLLKTSTIYKNFHLGGEKEESLEEMDGFVEK